MNQGLRVYLDSIGAKPIDPVALAEYERSMREEVIPKIEADMRHQRRLAHCLRFHPRGCRCSQSTPNPE